MSQQLRLLEREAGLPLVLRGPRGVALTEAGERLLTQADAIAAHLHLADEELADLAQLRAGRVRLVAFPSAAATLVPDALDALTRDHPGVSVEMVEAEPPEAAAAVRQGEADVAVVFGYPDHAGPGLQAPDDAADLAWVPLGDEPVSLVVDDGASTTLDDLRGGPRPRRHRPAPARAAGVSAPGGRGARLRPVRTPHCRRGPSRERRAGAVDQGAVGAPAAGGRPSA